MLFCSRYSISSWTSNRVWIVDFFCTTTLSHRYMDILFQFFSQYVSLVHPVI